MFYLREDVHAHLVAIATVAVTTWVAGGGHNTEHLRGVLCGLHGVALAVGLDWENVLQDVRGNVELSQKWVQGGRSLVTIQDAPMSRSRCH